MIVCHVCGTENPDGSKFCEGCGVELSVPTPVEAAVEAVVAAVPAFVPPTIETPEIVPALSAEVQEVAAAQVQEVANIAEAAIPGLAPLPEPEILPPPLPDLNVPTPDESALDLEPDPVAAVAPVVVAPVMAALESTLDDSVNPKATMETPISSAPRIARLIPRNLGASSSEGYVMHSERMVVGRFDPSAGPVDIDLSGGQGENYISRRHAEVYLENGFWLVRDLGSTNGVYVKRAGQAQYSPRIIEPQALSDGDEVAFGNMKFLFVYSSDAA
jgi:hypothetical protein